MEMVKNYEGLKEVNARRQSIEIILLKMGIITQEMIDAALLEQAENPLKKIDQILLENGSITEFDWIRAVGVKYKIPLVNLAAQTIGTNVLKYLSEKEAVDMCVIPVYETEYLLHVATSDPLNHVAFDTISHSSGKQVMPLLATSKDIIGAINQNYIRQEIVQIMRQIEVEFAAEIQVEEEAEMVDLSEFTDDGEDDGNSVTQAVRVIMEQAYQRGASDVHIEPIDKMVVVRIRVDGSLVETMSFTKRAYAQIVSRFKVLGGLDIGEKRVPQDGRISMIINEKKINMRLSTLPVLDGEKIVVRILGSGDPEDVLKLEDLDMEPYNYELLNEILARPNGIVLITGPTGSGKSTTVYAGLKKLFEPTINIITVEDPVERILPGVNQVQVNPKAGLTFSTGLRSILRQDPDIIMIGEIRDNETAEIAAKAAITGHLVVATLHTNDAASAFMRLMDMGVEPYLVSSAVAGVVAQLLVKRICQHCSEVYEPTAEQLSHLEEPYPEKMYKGRGCPLCNNTGYKGRIGVYEVIKVDEEIRKMINDHVDSETINQYLKEQCGFKTIIDNARLLVDRGVTTVDELIRIKNS